eukprot:symbB.v1.2.023502.t1/scaffold2074.1/size157288/2
MERSRQPESEPEFESASEGLAADLAELSLEPRVAELPGALARPAPDLDAFPGREAYPNFAGAVIVVQASAFEIRVERQVGRTPIINLEETRYYAVWGLPGYRGRWDFSGIHRGAGVQAYGALLSLNGGFQGLPFRRAESLAHAREIFLARAGDHRGSKFILVEGKKSQIRTSYAGMQRALDVDSQAVLERALEVLEQQNLNYVTASDDVPESSQRKPTRTVESSSSSEQMSASEDEDDKILEMLKKAKRAGKGKGIAFEPDLEESKSKGKKYPLLERKKEGQAASSSGLDKVLVQTLKRSKFAVSEILQAQLRGKGELAALQSVQLLRALYQANLDNGSWKAAALLMYHQDPLERPRFGGEPGQLEHIASYLKAIQEKRSAGLGERQDEEGGKGKKNGKGKKSENSAEAV